jgi:signal transduction histidine kinase/CheY-like chemotaxis protein
MREFQNFSRDDLIEALQAYERALDSPEDEKVRLLYELPLHQVELEIQNRDLREAQQALEETRNRYAELYDFAPVGYVTLTRNGVICDLNLTAASWFARERSVLIGMPIVNFLNPGAGHGMFDHLRRAFATGQVIVDETSLRPLEDRPGREIRLDSRVRNDADGPHCFTVMTDISDVKQAQKEREQLQRQLARAHKMEALGKVTGGVAHDFNNILATVMGFAELALNRHSQISQDKMENYLGKIIAASERGRDLVGQMLTFSRNDPVEAAPLQLLPFIREVLSLLRATLPSGIEIEEDLHPTPPVLLDPVEMQQVVMNLFVNARDAMLGKGKLTVSLRAIELRDLECVFCHRDIAGRWVELAIQDTGPGIAEDALDHLFEPFFTTKAVGKGAGMGLAIVIGILQRINGHVVVETPPGGGARMRLFFPPATASSPAAPPSLSAGPVPATGSMSGRILIVDDDPSITEFLQEALASKGLQVAACNDSSVALDVFGENANGFDCIITDQTMPKMTGIELTRAVRALNPHVPVILMSGYGSSVDATGAAGLGIDRCVGKPLKTGKLLQIVAELLSSRDHKTPPV